MRVVVLLVESCWIKLGFFVDGFLWFLELVDLVNDELMILLARLHATLL